MWCMDSTALNAQLIPVTRLVVQAMSTETFIVMHSNGNIQNHISLALDDRAKTRDAPTKSFDEYVDVIRRVLEDAD